ncbi:MAG: AAA family ATPase [Desulfuromonadales bacterium]|nr:AAA family ATPase [Desulfuromonadales bacterium]
MPQDTLNIVLEMERGTVDASALKALEALDQAKLTLCADLTREKLVDDPAIIMIDDRPEEIDTVSRIRTLKQKFPGANIFVVSTDQRPQHIVNLMKSGVSEYLGNPPDIHELTTAIEEIRIKRANSGQVVQGTTYSFVGSKGGLGSTVLAVNSAVSLAVKSRQSILLCDMSLQSGDASVLLDVPPGPTIVDLSRNIHRFDVSLFRGAVTRHKSGIDFLAAPPDPEDSSDVNADHVSQIFDLSNKLYEHVVVDCPAMSLDPCTLTALQASDKIFIVTDLSVTAVRNASRYRELIQKIGFDPSRIEFVINRYIKGSALSIEEVESTLKKKIFWLFPNDFISVVSSINRGTPLVKFQPGAVLAKNINEFVDKMQNPNACGNYRGLKGTFGKAI